MTQSHGESLEHLKRNIDELVFHIESEKTGFHCVPDSDVERGSADRYERTFQVELDASNTRIEVTGLVSAQQSNFVATLQLSDEGQSTNPSTELGAQMSDGQLGELSGSIHGQLEAKQRRQSTNPPRGSASDT